MASLQLDFDADRLERTMSSPPAFPKASVFNHIGNDMFGNVAAETRAPGPFADPGAKRVLRVDPRAGFRQEATSEKH